MFKFWTCNLYTHHLCVSGSIIYFTNYWQTIALNALVLITLLLFSRKLKWGRQLPKLLSTFQFLRNPPLYYQLYHFIIRWNYLIHAKQVQKEKDRPTLGKIYYTQRGQSEGSTSRWPLCSHHLRPEDNIQADSRDVLVRVLCSTAGRGQQERRRSDVPGSFNVSGPPESQHRAFEYLQIGKRSYFPWENVELWERGQMSGKG